MGITILEGDFNKYHSVTPKEGGITYILPTNWWFKSCFAPVEKVERISDLTSEKGSEFSPLWGFVGMEVLGPAGLLLGANRKKRKQSVLFKCTLKDGRYFVGSTSPREYQTFCMITSMPIDTVNRKYDLLITAIIIAIIMAIMIHLGRPYDPSHIIMGRGDAKSVFQKGIKSTFGSG